jgi:hypothetical protein
MFQLVFLFLFSNFAEGPIMLDPYIFFSYIYFIYKTNSPTH